MNFYVARAENSRYRGSEEVKADDRRSRRIGQASERRFATAAKRRSAMVGAWAGVVALTGS
jgi:hypothetical protein